MGIVYTNKVYIPNIYYQHSGTIFTYVKKFETYMPLTVSTKCPLPEEPASWLEQYRAAARVWYDFCWDLPLWDPPDQLAVEVLLSTACNIYVETMRITVMINHCMAIKNS